MKTKCYCVGCKKHPLHSKRKEFKKWYTGFYPGYFVDHKYDEQGVDVDCLMPESSASDYVNLDDFEYPITAYGDGSVVTGAEVPGLIIYATCKNEEYED